MSYGLTVMVKGWAIRKLIINKKSLMRENTTQNGKKTDITCNSYKNSRFNPMENPCVTIVNYFCPSFKY